MSDSPRFDPSTLTQVVSDTLTVRRVYGEAYERDGVQVIPVARVWGASGTAAGDGDSRGGGELHLPRVTLPWLRWGGRDVPIGAADAADAPAATETADGVSEAADEDAETQHDDSDDTAGAWPADGSEVAEGYGHGRGRSSGHGGVGTFGVHVRAVGVYVVDDAGVHWRPAVDVNRVILGAQVAGAAAVSVVALAVAVKSASNALAKGLTGIATALAQR